MMRDRILKPISLSLLGKKKRSARPITKSSLFYRALSFIAKKKRNRADEHARSRLGAKIFRKVFGSSLNAKELRAASSLSLSLSLSSIFLLSFSYKIWHRERERGKKNEKLRYENLTPRVRETVRFVVRANVKTRNKSVPFVRAKTFCSVLQLKSKVRVCLWRFVSGRYIRIASVIGSFFFLFFFLVGSL